MALQFDKEIYITALMRLVPRHASKKPQAPHAETAQGLGVFFQQGEHL
jgi:hypothetical protein